MGVVGLVAGGVFAVHDVDRVVGHLLDILAQQEAFALLGGHALDLRLARVDVVEDGVHRVGRGSLREDGTGLGACRGIVHDARGVDLLAAQLDPHEVGLEVHVAVGDVALLVDVDHLVLGTVHQRVGVLAADDRVQKVLDQDRVVPGGVGAERIGLRQRIGGLGRAECGQTGRPGVGCRAGQHGAVRPCGQFGQRVGAAPEQGFARGQTVCGGESRAENQLDRQHRGDQRAEIF